MLFRVLCFFVLAAFLAFCGEDKKGSSGKEDDVALDSSVSLVALGYAHICVGDQSGDVRCMGRYSDAGNSFQIVIEPPKDPIDFGDDNEATFLTSYRSETCALLQDGKPACWEIGSVPTEYEDYNFEGVTFEKIAVGNAGVCGIDVNDSIRCFGGPFRDDTIESDWDNPNQVPLRIDVGIDPEKAIDIAYEGGYSRFCAAMEDGNVWCWPSESPEAVTKTYDDEKDIIAISSNCRLHKDGSVMCDQHVHEPDVKDITQITYGHRHGCGIDIAGEVFCWGDNRYGQLGQGYISPGYESGLKVALDKKAVQVVAGENSTCVLLEDNSMRCFGSNEYGQLGRGVASAFVLPGESDVAFTDAGGAFGLTSRCALLENGEAQCWGTNQAGALGTGNEKGVYAPVAVPYPGGKKIKQISDIKSIHRCAVDVDGGFACWGNNLFGQLGTGDKEDRLTPTSVSHPDKVTAIGTGMDFTCILTEDGDVTCFGSNIDYQIGYGSTAATVYAPLTSYLDFGDERKVKSMATGVDHSCVILDDDTVKCWGNNDTGALGSGDFKDVEEPLDHPGVAFETGKIPVQVIAGSGESCAIMDDGSITCWGRVDFSPWTPTDNPADVATPIDYIRIDGEKITSACVGAQHLCSLTESSQIYCWGKNSFGQLGLPPEVLELYSPDQPVDLGGGRSAKGLSCTSSSTCALLDDGSMTCWGNNDSGDLGSSYGVFWGP